MRPLVQQTAKFRRLVAQGFFARIGEPCFVLMDGIQNRLEPLPLPLVAGAHESPQDAPENSGLFSIKPMRGGVGRPPPRKETPKGPPPRPPGPPPRGRG